MDSFMAEKVKYKTQVLIGISMKWMKNYEKIGVRKMERLREINSRFETPIPMVVFI